MSRKLKLASLIHKRELKHANKRRLLPMTSKKDEELIPFESRHLIERLDEAYPPRCKTLNESEEEHQRYAGIRTLVDELKGLLSEQDNED